MFVVSLSISISISCLVFTRALIQKVPLPGQAVDIELQIRRIVDTYISPSVRSPLLLSETIENNEKES